MIQFLTPLWLLGLPLAILPWIWPMLRRQKKPFLFSAFFLLPTDTRRKRFLFSLEEWLLKLLRSLIILFLFLILAQPVWLERVRPTEVWIVDDTLSRYFPETDEALSRYLQNQGLSLVNNDVLRLSELLPLAEKTPVITTGNWEEVASGSPTLAQIASLVLQRIDTQEEQQLLRVHLISDFQWSQFQFYRSATQNIEWEFHRPEALLTSVNLGLRKLHVQNGDLFNFQLQAEIYGHYPQTFPLQVKVLQSGQTIGSQEVEWKGRDAQLVEVKLDKNFERHKPIEVILDHPQNENRLDNVRFYQQSRLNPLWAAIFTSEGNAGIYRHGLHQLKSALNANQVFSFLSTTATDVQTYQPDVLLLLGDHPIRWEDSLKTVESKLFIPTRLGDWRAFAQPVADLSDETTGSLLGDTNANTGTTEADATNEDTPDFPVGQWVVDWSQTELAEPWGIQKVNDHLYYSESRNMWLLATGISPAWGPLYKDVVFADVLQEWLTHIVEAHSQQYLGTFEAGNPLPSAVGQSSRWTQWKPGHYSVGNEGQQKTYHFSINLPSSESLPRLLTDEELLEMRQYFERKAEQEQMRNFLPSADKLREWLLWILLAFTAAEILYVMARLLRTRTA